LKKTDDISGTFINEAKGIDSPAQITLDIFKNQKMPLTLS